jgi:transposase-like protein
MSRGDTGWLRTLRGRRHWQHDEAARVLDAWAVSGESMAAFARRHGLRAERLSWWKARLGAPQATAGDSLTLVPLTVRAAPSDLAAVVLVVDGASARLDVRQPERVPARWLADVTSLLMGRAS